MIMLHGVVHLALLLTALALPLAATTASARGGIAAFQSSSEAFHLVRGRHTRTDDRWFLRNRPSPRAAVSSFPVLLLRAVPEQLVDGGASRSDDETVDLSFLRAELLQYLEKRGEVDADTLAKQDVGRQVGGTRGNAWLEYVSLAPNKGSIITDAPNMFDYSELDRYGYAHLATPIMRAGGRLAMYDLMGLDRPIAPRKVKPRPSAPIVMDRTGQNDAARYSGLKLGQVLDDNLQATVLAEAERKAREGQSLRPKLMEEDYVRPFADVKPTSASSNPYWTPAKLDEWGKMRGKVIADAQREQADQLVVDRMESLDLELPLRLYTILTGVLASIAFGKATPTFFAQVLHVSNVDGLEAVKLPAAVLLLACVGSSVFCATQASQKKRNAVVWTIRGLLGGPLAMAQLKDLPDLVTRREFDARRQG